MAGDRFNLPEISVHPPRSAEDLLAQIELVIEKRQAETLKSDWQLQQRDRQGKLGIRGGGAPASLSEARGQFDEILRQRGYLAGGGRDFTKEQKAAATEAFTEAWKRFDAIVGGAKVAILFKSGGPFIYTNSIPQDYARLAAAGSKGREVWKMGWGPNRSPAYLPIFIPENRVIHTQSVSSSWLLQIWLISDTELD